MTDKEIEGRFDDIDSILSMRNDSIVSLHRRIQILRDVEIPELRNEMQELRDRLANIQEKEG